jgi:putative colanic acid biosynthesis acetyltransferase WcaF
MPINLAEFDNREFSRGRSRLVEILWLLTQSVFVSSWLPGSMHRCILLRIFGASIGKGVNIKSRVRVTFPWRLKVGDHSWIGEDAWIDNLAIVEIGANCCISQGVYLCTGSHDWSKSTFDLITRPIHIEDGAWIAARANIGPGVRVGKGAILCLGSVATKDLQPWTINFGNPVRTVRNRRVSDAQQECH